MAYAIKDKAIRDNMLRMCQDESVSDADVMQSIVKTAKWIETDDISAFWKGEDSAEDIINE